MQYLLWSAPPLLLQHMTVDVASPVPNQFFQSFLETTWKLQVKLPQQTIRKICTVKILTVFSTGCINDKSISTSINVKCFTYTLEIITINSVQFLYCWNIIYWVCNEWCSVLLSWLWRDLANITLTDRKLSSQCKEIIILISWSFTCYCQIWMSTNSKQVYYCCVGRPTPAGLPDPKAPPLR